MLSAVQIRTLFLYEFKMGHNASLAMKNINDAFEDVAVNERTIRRWFGKFRSGDFSLENEPRGKPETLVDDDVLRATVDADPTKSVREIAQSMGVSPMTISRHLSLIGKVKKLDKWVPHELNESQKLRRLEICASLRLRNQTEPFLHRIVTCDEKWILYDNRKRPGQWLDAGEKPKHTPKPDLHPKKVMVTIWWTSKGPIHFSFLQPGETINAIKYCEEIDILHAKLAEKQPALVNRHGPILLHDNARPHTSQVTVQKLLQLGFEILPHPPYSPDISPTDYHLFRNLDSFCRQKVFRNRAEVIKAFEDFIASKSQHFYEKGIFDLVSRWKNVIDANGSYFD